MVVNEILLPFCHKFYCKICDYGTSKKSSYNDHILSAKHKKSMVINGSSTEFCCFSAQNKLYECLCGKKYKDNSGLWRHKKVCKIIEYENNKLSENQDLINDKNTPSDKELMMILIKQNTDLQNLIMNQQNSVLELCKNGIYNNNNNTTNSHNKTFNLNMFLNETCKNAMNISDFMNSIQLQLSDLESVGELGYVNGISNIIIKNLKELDITQRPIHCTDVKREIIYVKDKDKWEKEGEQNELMVGFVKNVANKNIRMLNEFKKKYPDCCKYESKYSDYYSKLIIEAMGGTGGSDEDKHAKIIKKICKEVTIDKSIL
jgi:hypothetical protein